MRIVWVAVALLVLTLGFSALVLANTGAVYRDLQDNLNRLEKAVELENWKQAEQESKKLEALWAKADSFWTPVMDHREVDRVDESITRVVRLVELRSREELLVEIAVSKRQLRRLKDNEYPGIGNVF